MMHGIDVSHWQSGLHLANTDAEFVIAKATQGTGTTDPSCNGFVNQAKQHGMLWGTYHFAENAGNLLGEADHYYNSVRNYVGHGLLVLDWEKGNLGNVSGAKSWLDHVYNRAGVRPIIYMSQSTANSHDWSSVARDYALWVARYNDTIGPTGAWKSVLMWQYTDAHHTGGYAVDGDRFYGDKTTWNAYVTGSKSNNRPDTDTTEEDDVTPQDIEKIAKAVWAEEFAKWAADTTGNEGKPVAAAMHMNQARGYAEDGYDRIKKVESDVAAIRKHLGV